MSSAEATPVALSERHVPAKSHKSLDLVVDRRRMKIPPFLACRTVSMIVIDHPCRRGDRELGRAPFALRTCADARARPFSAEPFGRGHIRHCCARAPRAGPRPAVRGA